VYQRGGVDRRRAAGHDTRRAASDCTLWRAACTPAQPVPDTCRPRLRQPGTPFSPAL